MFDGIKNATTITAGKKPLSSLGVKAEGDYKLVVTLDRRIPYFKNLMTFALFFPQAEKAVKKYGSNYGTTSKYMLYNGPYMQKGWTGSNLSWKMVKNKYYLNCLLDQTGNQECQQRQPRRLAVQVRQREITKSVREHKCKKSLEKPDSFLL
ncbi:lipoprotein, peptide binding protein oppa-like protein [Lactobacillus delbrueckii]|uniref:Lipoprotein, peptide binding protein oppa-like protein n=1 Tax=Lactobacillus delbrueckii TaxID=1584 RepID=A0A4V2E138_9LACO|nr:lipoprotein, peptide binding protein oppa-like protein [Lactobacillus delbrueckii]